ncbi:hypothetical protein MC885_017170 [Smutsia gigantea]|nr:hypothetical protein MC885_017170 [Smutsia gigantea]
MQQQRPSQTATLQLRAPRPAPSPAPREAPFRGPPHQPQTTPELHPRRSHPLPFRPRKEPPRPQHVRLTRPPLLDPHPSTGFLGPPGGHRSGTHPPPSLSDTWALGPGRCQVRGGTYAPAPPPNLAWSDLWPPRAVPRPTRHELGSRSAAEGAPRTPRPPGAGTQRLGPPTQPCPSLMAQYTGMESLSSPLTTHVLDTASGLPAQGLCLHLSRLEEHGKQWTELRKR